MLLRTLADIVVLVHLAFILFALLGALMAFRWAWIPWVHVPVVVWAAAVEFLDFYCPLTPLENRLREAAGEAGYPGGFIEHYLIPVIYPDDLSRTLQIFLGSLVVVINLLAYLAVWRRRRGRS